MNGVDQAGTSNMVGRTLTNGMPAGRVMSQLRQFGQYSYFDALCSAPMAVSPITSTPSAGIIAVSENALALSFWHPVQWHAAVMMGGAVTRSFTCPHMHEPSIEGDVVISMPAR